MLFSEIYSAYYNTVAAILTEAVVHPVMDEELINIIEKYAFEESKFVILEELKKEKWQLIRKDGTTPIKNKPTMPLTLLQKRWLKAVMSDPRIQLFGEMNMKFSDVEPLFLPSDISIFDQYDDGDPYSDAGYIANFRLILEAIQKKIPLDVYFFSKKGKKLHSVILPEYLEYSEKDDKFRLVGSDSKFKTTINLGRIAECTFYKKPFLTNYQENKIENICQVSFELTDQRNTLERVLLHFAHFKKCAKKVSDDRYLVTIYYDKEDEMEMVIRILSFGPTIKVVEPTHFIELIKKRLIEQKSCEI